MADTRLASGDTCVRLVSVGLISRSTCRLVRSSWHTMIERLKSSLISFSGAPAGGTVTELSSAHTLKLVSGSAATGSMALGAVTESNKNGRFFGVWGGKSSYTLA
eukprot:2061949-Prymnesium_polylepis.1